ncbi:MAG: hypothetical protein HHJ12_00930 [Glaciimonas sp.]|nr:hypothetical protein [Glaciimonas sp.]
MLHRYSRLWLPVLILAVFLGGCEPDAKAPKPSTPKPTAASPVEAETARFLEKHWARPLAPQGKLPAAAQGISLAPQSCAGCHASQFKDWSKSRHSRAMGPGILGQLQEMPAHARDDHQSCIRCHAPLAEQADSLVAALEKQANKQAGGKPEIRPLHQQGLVCAACHVRNNEWHGPPRRNGSQPGGDLSAYPHAGWKANRAFESSQFCAACHQFKGDEYALNGKLLENTYKEWQDSRYARQGVSCQSCHMPDRRHLWRGIHDPEMVKKGVGVRAGAASIANGQVAARLSVANTGVGHYFPTYVTPKILIRGFQQDASGHKLDGTEQQFVIGRQVTLDLSTEIADTRIAPDAEATFDYRMPRHVRATSLMWQAEVQPDAFYLEFYVSLLQGEMKAGSRQLIAQARDNAGASPYIVFSRRLALP